MENINKDKEKYNTEENRRKVEENMSKILGQRIKCLSIKVRDDEEKRETECGKEDVCISEEQKHMIDEKLSEILGQEAKCSSVKWKTPYFVEKDLLTTIVKYENGEEGLVNIRMLTKK